MNCCTRDVGADVGVEWLVRETQSEKIRVLFCFVLEEGLVATN